MKTILKKASELMDLISEELEKREEFFGSITDRVGNQILVYQQ